MFFGQTFVKLLLFFCLPTFILAHKRLSKRPSDRKKEDFGGPGNDGGVDGASVQSRDDNKSYDSKDSFIGYSKKYKREDNNNDNKNDKKNDNKNGNNNDNKNNNKNGNNNDNKNNNKNGNKKTTSTSITNKEVIKNHTQIHINNDDEDIDASEQEKIEEYNYLKSFNWTVHCKFQKNERVCSEHKISRRYFFDLHTQRCKRFTYGHCRDVFNIFTTKVVCRDQCQDHAYAKLEQDQLKPAIFCRFQPEFGDCSSYHPSFYFDITIQKCVGFAYSGCGGNRNRFSDKKSCIHVCGLDSVLSLD